MNRIKVLGLILVVEYVLESCCKHLKTDTGLYQRKVKSLVNQLHSTLIPILKSSISLKTVEEATKITGREIDIEEISEDISVQGQILEMMTEILLEANINKIHQTHLLLSNIIENKRVYTESECNRFLEEAQQNVANHYINRMS